MNNIDKIAVLTPTLRLSGIYFWLDLNELLFHLIKGHNLVFHHNDSSAPLDVKRENLALRALDDNVDWLLWLDMDMRFGPEVFEKLAKWDKDIVSGIYLDRYGKNICKLKGQKEISKEKLRQGKLIKIESTGFGVLLVKAEVFKQLKRPWFEWQLGRPEDLDWCIKAQEQGFKIYCDPTTFLGHGFACRSRWFYFK